MRGDGRHYSVVRGGRSRIAVALVVFAVLSAAGLAALSTSATAVTVSPRASFEHGSSFAVRCDFSHRLSDDPIVYPGQAGAAHSHDFFGNTTTSADSTAEGLRATGTTCTRPRDTAAYWIPTVSWDGQELQADRAVFYYRSGGKNRLGIKAHPAGLKVVTPRGGHVQWRCGRSGKGSARPPTSCDLGVLGVRIIFPDCSNGRIDSADHTSHMAYSRPRDGAVRCPKAYPRPVPALTINATFPIPVGPGGVTLSSGSPSTMHADFFNAWDQQALAGLVERCIRDVPPSKKRPPECRAPSA